MSQGTYYVPEQSRWPILASIALFFMAFGAANLMNSLGQESGSGLYFLLSGTALMLMIMFGWFRHVVIESMKGLYSAQMDRSFRWGMSWFIFSEVMFFAAFFGALFYIRVFAVPWLGGEGDKGVSQMLWEGFTPAWPLLSNPDSALFPPPSNIIDPWHLPLLNTIILIASSFTLTLAHHALKRDQRKSLILWHLLTVILGLIFLALQAAEYVEAYEELGLTLQSGIYGSTFFILTGFHGAHVTLGTVMLIIIWLRVLKGHFSPQQHFGYEAVAWYWHFVDVVWIGLFLFVYVF